MPARESIRSLAAHGATMILFLSMGVIDSLQAELIEGGIAPEMPAAIVYKATWPDERIYRCTVGALDATARENRVTKTASSGMNTTGASSTARISPRSSGAQSYEARRDTFVQQAGRRNGAPHRTPP